MTPKARFKIIEIKIRALKDSDLTDKMDRLIKPSWQVISADYLVSANNWWFYRVLVDTNPTAVKQRAESAHSRKAKQ